MAAETAIGFMGRSGGGTLQLSSPAGIRSFGHVRALDCLLGSHPALCESSCSCTGISADMRGPPKRDRKSPTRRSLFLFFFARPLLFQNLQ
jgi:hypothetical protein